MPRAAAVSLAIAALAIVLVQGPPLARHPLTDDERDYLAGAISLARDGTLAFSLPPPGEAPRPSAYREPLYPALLAAVWRTTGSAPATISAFEADSAEGARARRAVSWTHFALLLAAAGAAAGLARAAGAGPIAAAVAALVVGSSPALRFYAGEAAAETLAAPLLAAAALAFLAAWERNSRLLFTLAGALWGASALTRAAFAPVGLALLAAAAVAALAGDRISRRARLAHLAWAALLFASPIALWAARNRSVTGFFVLADRGGTQLYLRTELGAVLAGGEARAAWLEWTPLEAAQSRRRERYPTSDVADWRQRGPGNYYLRTMRLRSELAASTGNPVAADRELRRRALARIAAAPLELAATAPLVAWRGLFAERSPSWALPLDLRFALGLGLALALLVAIALALRRRDPALAWLAAILVLSAALHAFASEGLPRYGVPMLPLAWALAVAVVARGWSGKTTGPPEA